MSPRDSRCPHDTSTGLWRGVVWTRGDTTPTWDFLVSPSVMPDTSASPRSYIHQKLLWNRPLKPGEAVGALLPRPATSASWEFQTRSWELGGVKNISHGWKSVLQGSRPPHNLFRPTSQATFTRAKVPCMETCECCNTAKAWKWESDRESEGEQEGSERKKLRMNYFFFFFLLSLKLIFVPRPSWNFIYGSFVWCPTQVSVGLEELHQCLSCEGTVHILWLGRNVSTVRVKSQVRV